MSTFKRRSHRRFIAWMIAGFFAIPWVVAPLLVEGSTPLDPTVGSEPSLSCDSDPTVGLQLEAAGAPAPQNSQHSLSAPVHDLRSVVHLACHFPSLDKSGLARPPPSQ